ncbi:MAG: hypothetical protein IJP71_03960 [Lachnospiraceae bacterium]|nr:hypothetical protein [Lachnospiraceae bacterium]
MEDRELKKIAERKENIKKYIDRLFATTSVNAESNITEELIKEAKKLGVAELTSMAAELDIFGKCVFHYRLPIDFRLDTDFSKATEVIESERKLYWKEYKQKLLAKNLNPEEEYNKIILMACTLHVPIKDEEQAPEGQVTEEQTTEEATPNESTQIEQTELL